MRQNVSSIRHLCWIAVILFLIMSHTQMCVQAQNAVLSAPLAAPDMGIATMQVPTDNMTEMQLADVLSGAFRAAAATDPSLQGVPTNLTGASIMQQSALGDLSGASASIKSMNIRDIGTGANIARLQAGIDDVRKSFQSIKKMMGPSQAADVLQSLNQAQGFLLQFLQAFPLAELNFLAASLTSAGFILVTIGGALYSAGSGTLLGAEISGLYATLQSKKQAKEGTDGTQAKSANAAGALSEEQWAQQVLKAATGTNQNMLELLLSGNIYKLMDVGDNILSSVMNVVKQGSS